MGIRMIRVFGPLMIVSLASILLFFAGHSSAKPPQGTMGAEAKEQPFVIEYYYKAKWGHAE